MNQVEDLLVELHRKFDKELEDQRMTRGLDVITDMVMGMSYLMLGLAIPTVSNTMHQVLLDWSLPIVATSIYSIFLVWIGARLMKAAWSAKAFFLNHPEHLPSFLAIFQEDTVAGPALNSWLSRTEIKETPFAKHLKRVGTAFQVGWLTALLIGVSYLLLYFGAMFLLLSNSLGTFTAAAVLGALTIGYAGAIWAVVRFALRKRRPLTEQGVGQGHSSQIILASPPTVGAEKDAKKVD